MKWVWRNDRMIETSEQFDFPPKRPNTNIEAAWTPAAIDIPRADGLFPEFQGERLLITTKNDLDQLVRRLKGEKWIALATQQNAATTRRPIICTIQFAWAGGVAVVWPEEIIDDLNRLNELTQDQRIIKFSHEAAADARHLSQLFGIGFTSLIDTRLLYEDTHRKLNYKLSFSELINEVIRPPKRIEDQTRIGLSDWRHRPLSAAQHIAALRAVYYLRPAGIQMLAGLEPGRILYILRATHAEVFADAWTPDVSLCWEDVYRIMRIDDKTPRNLSNVAAALVKDRRQNSIVNNVCEALTPTDHDLRHWSKDFVKQHDGVDRGGKRFDQRTRAMLNMAYRAKKTLSLRGELDFPHRG